MVERVVIVVEVVVVVVVVVVAVVVTVKEQLAVANRWLTSTTWVAEDVTHSMLRMSKQEVVA